MNVINIQVWWLVALCLYCVVKICKVGIVIEGDKWVGKIFCSDHFFFLSWKGSGNKHNLKMRKQIRLEDIMKPICLETFNFLNLQKNFISGFMGVYLAGYILETTNSWAAVFQITAALNMFGCLVFLMFGSGNAIVWVCSIVVLMMWLYILFWHLALRTWSGM